LPCVDGEADCDGNAANGCETDLATSEPHCGACGHDCSGGTCDDGACLIETPAFGCRALAVDDANVYRAGNDLTKSSKKGGGAAVLGPYPAGIALDSTDVFYIRDLSPDPSEVGRVSKSGGPTSLLATTPSTKPPGGVAVDATSVVWTELIYSQWDPAGGSLRSMPKAGGAITTLASGLDGPEHIALDATHAYWTQNDQVMRVPLSGGTPEVVASGQVWPRFVAVDGTHAYWATSTFIGCPCSLSRAPLAGGAVEVLAQPTKSVAYVTLDDASVYWVEWSTISDADGAVKRVPKSGGAVEVVADELEQPDGLAVDDESVYFCTWDTEQSASPSLVKIAKD